MHLTSFQIFDRQYRLAVIALRPSLDRESAVRTVAAPLVVNLGRGTSRSFIRVVA